MPWEDSAATRERVPAGAALLYPAATARPLTALTPAERPRHLVVLDGSDAGAGLKIGDVDPRLDRSACYEISDKALAIGGGVVEAVLWWP